MPNVFNAWWNSDEKINIEIILKPIIWFGKGIPVNIAMSDLKIKIYEEIIIIGLTKKNIQNERLKRNPVWTLWINNRDHE